MLVYDNEDYGLTFHKEYHKLVNKYGDAFELWFEKYGNFKIMWDLVEGCFKQDYIGHYGDLALMECFKDKYPKWCDEGHVFRMKTFYDMEFDRG